MPRVAGSIHTYPKTFQFNILKTVGWQTHFVIASCRG